MLFNTPEYLVFFLIILALGWLLVGWPRLRIMVLLLGSYYFYTSNNHWLILLLLFTTHVDWLAGLYISRARTRRAKKGWLCASLVLNVGTLAFFKYCNFFASSITALAGFLGFRLDWVDLNVLLPVGISFYTFQSMTYTIDVYRGVIPAETSWYRFAFFVAYFPHLIAGPIVRASLFLPQIQARPHLYPEELDVALMRIFRGLFKKIVLADFLATHADAAFNAPAASNSLVAWIGLYAFTFQIYFDFSGYTDLALGCARLMGFRLAENFNLPYAVKTFSEFWRRWHMTLSEWLRDYLYIPLGGSRTGSIWKNQRNLLVTMGLCGLWHGAAWTFVIWGLLHGMILCLERWLGVNKDSGAPSLWRSLIMFHLVALSWIPFRAKSFTGILDYCQALVSGDFTGPFTVGMSAVLGITAAALLTQFLAARNPTRSIFLRLPLGIRAVAYAMCWAAVLIFNSSGAKTFIYFQF